MSDQAILESINAELKRQGIEVEPQEEARAEEPEAVEEIEAVEETVEEKVASGIEALAERHGWDPNKEKSAEEFVEYALKNLEPRGKEIKELKSTLDELKSMMDKQQELGYKKAVEELKAQRLEAIRDGDVSEVDRLDVEIQKNQSNIKDEQSAEVNSFLERNNSWIKDPSYRAQQIRDFAHKRDQELAAFNLNPHEHLKTIEADIKSEFKDYFHEEPAEVPTVSVESSGSAVSGTRVKKTTFNDLSPEQKTICRQFERQGVMSADEYIKQLKEIGAL